jgi:hypothetical protein
VNVHNNNNNNNDDDDDNKNNNKYNNIFLKDHIAYVQIVLAQDLIDSDAIFMIVDL